MVEDHRRLVSFLAERMGDSPYLAYVDIGGVGNTGGEWFLSPEDPYVRAGYDDEAHLELVRTFVTMYREAFPRTRLFISYDCITFAQSSRRPAFPL